MPLKSRSEVTKRDIKFLTCHTNLEAYSLKFENVNTIFGNGIGELMKQVTFVRVMSNREEELIVELPDTDLLHIALQIAYQ